MSQRIWSVFIHRFPRHKSLEEARAASHADAAVHDGEKGSGDEMWEPPLWSRSTHDTDGAFSHPRDLKKEKLLHRFTVNARALVGGGSGRGRSGRGPSIGGAAHERLCGGLLGGM